MLALKKRVVGLATAAVFSALGVAMMAGIAGNTSTAEGFSFRPEIGDEVAIAFEHGDVRFPYVIDSVWNGKDQPPE